MRSFLKTLLLLVIILLALPPLVFAGDAPPLAIHAAEQCLTDLKSSKLSLHDQGFETREDVLTAALGEGFEIFTIPPDRLLDDSTPQNLKSLVTSTHQWMFLILVKGKPKTVVTVGPVDGKTVDGKWMWSELGSTGFAKALGDFLTAWPPSFGYRYRFIRVYQVGATLIEVSKGNDVVGIVPGSTLLELITRAPLKDYDPHTVVEEREILPALRFAVKSNIELWKR